MNHDNATFEIHVHGDIPIKPGTDAKALQEALKPLWQYAGARSLRRCKGVGKGWMDMGQAWACSCNARILPVLTKPVRAG